MSKQRTDAQWRELIEAHVASGMTTTQFCRARGLNAKYFSTRRRALEVSPSKPPSAFAAVSLAPSPLGARMTVSDGTGITIELPAETSPDAVARLVIALRT